MNVFHVVFQIVNIVVSLIIFFVSVFLSQLGVELPSSIDPVLFGVIVSAIFYLSLSRISQILELSQRVGDIESKIEKTVSERIGEFRQHFDYQMSSLRENVITLTEESVIPKILASMSVQPIAQQKQELDRGFSLESVHKVHVCFKRRTMILIMAR